MPSDSQTLVLRISNSRSRVKVCYFRSMSPICEITCAWLFDFTASLFVLPAEKLLYSDSSRRLAGVRDDMFVEREHIRSSGLIQMAKHKL
ncbi:hypothetical protein ACU8KH_06671 [Lachancea thermotolerans]